MLHRYSWLCSFNTKPIDEDIQSPLCYAQEIEHLQRILCFEIIPFRTFTYKDTTTVISIVKRNHVSTWNWIQRYNAKKIIRKRRKVSEFIIDETLLQVGKERVWVLVAIEPTDKIILGISITFIHSDYEKSIIERTIQYVKDRTGGFYD